VTVFGWLVLGLVFVDEVLAVVAAGVWGGYAGGVLLAVLAPLVTLAAWFLLASPKARYGGPVVRPLVKAVVFTLASVGLWAAGDPTAAVALFVFSAVVNAVAQLPSIRALVPAPGGPPAE
jgi:uncharacterized protein DUF2568